MYEIVSFLARKYRESNYKMKIKKNCNTSTFCISWSSYSFLKRSSGKFLHQQVNGLDLQEEN